MDDNKDSNKISNNITNNNNKKKLIKENALFESLAEDGHGQHVTKINNQTIDMINIQDEKLMQLYENQKTLYEDLEKINTFSVTKYTEISEDINNINSNIRIECTNSKLKFDNLEINVQKIEKNNLINEKNINILIEKINNIQLKQDFIMNWKTNIENILNKLLFLLMFFIVILFLFKLIINF